MKHKYFLYLLFLLFAMDTTGQTEDTTGYRFTIVKKLDATTVKNQFRTNTCWSFSALSLMESELLRQGKGEFDFSEMFIVRNAYIKKAEKYVRMHGTIGFTGGGALNNVPDVIRTNGILPETAYPGKRIDTANHIHAEMDEVLKSYLDGVLKNPNKKLSPVWMEGFCGILDAYLGALPQSFEWDGKTMDAIAFASALDLSMDNFVLLTSFTHHPFYSKFILEVPDNWSWGEAFNVPVDELIEIIDYSLMNDHTVAWATDISEKGFSFSKGLAIVPEEEFTQPVNIKVQETSFGPPLKEAVITQAMRQQSFDNYLTTDDHGMHITGIVKDHDGNKFYYVKNSWGTHNPYQGYLYVSEQFVRYKTLTMLVNKNAIPKDILKKLNL